MRVSDHVRNGRIYSAIGSLILLAVTALHAEARLPLDSGFKLTFAKPATKWTAAVPLGNGRIGAMEFGRTEDERLQVNESTLWGGSPHNYTNPEAHARWLWMELFARPYNNRT